MGVQIVTERSDRTFLATWTVFNLFATEVARTASDGLLFETGTYRFSGRERFTVDLVRQFEVVDEDGDHNHYVQLRCEFLYEPTDELRALGSSTIWYFPSEGDSLAEWLAEVESQSEFEWAANLVPSAATVSQEAV